LRFAMKRLICTTALIVAAAFCLSLPLLRAQGVTYTTLDPSGSTGTQATGISGNNVVGWYVDGNSVDHGFIYNNGTYTTLDPTGSLYTQALGVDGNNVVGTCYLNKAAGLEGFLYNGGNYTTINPSGSTSTQALGVSGANVVGYYYDSNQVTHGFLYNGGVYTTIDPPGSTYTRATGVSGNNVVGWYVDASEVTHGFLYNSGTYTTIDPAGTSGTEAYGVSSNSVVGWYVDGGNVDHGFLYKGGAYTVLDPPGSTETVTYGVSANNLAGFYNHEIGGNQTEQDGFLDIGWTTVTLDPPAASLGTVTTGVSNNSTAGYYLDSLGFSHGFLATVTVTFAQWGASFPIATGGAATPENDGIPNLLKYLYDINPTRAMTAADRTALPVFNTIVTGGTKYLTLTYRHYMFETGINLNVQTSSDLKTWTTVANPTQNQIGTDPTTGDSIMQVQVAVTSAREFIRLNVTSP